MLASSGRTGCARTDAPVAEHAGPTPRASASVGREVLGERCLLDEALLLRPHEREAEHALSLRDRERTLVLAVLLPQHALAREVPDDVLGLEVRDPRLGAELR